MSSNPLCIRFQNSGALGSHKQHCKPFKDSVTSRGQNELQLQSVISPLVLPPWQTFEGTVWMMTTDPKTGRSGFFRVLNNDPRYLCQFA